MSKEINQELLEKYLRKECTVEEAQEVILWLKDEQNKDELEHLMQLTWESESKNLVKQEKLNEIHSTLLEKITHNTKSTSPARKYSLFFKIAVSISLLILFQITFFYFQSHKGSEVTETLQIIKSTSSGEKLTSRLPDGTMVTLNADSKLVFPKNFHGPTRNIQLTGEAFFEVAKDKGRPFIVHSGPVAIKAVGTAFNVNANPDSHIVVSLTEGSVLVHSNSENNDSENAHYLVPGEEVTYSKEGEYLNKNKFNNKTAVGWKDGLLVFESDNISQIKTKIEKWYGVKLVLINQPTDSWQFTGEYKNENLDNVLKGLKYSKKIDYIINNDNVEITFD